MATVSDQLLQLVRLLVDSPAEVEVFESDADRSVRYELKVAPSDLGKVIGRQGRAIRALRSLVSARADGDDRHYELEILED